MTAQPPVKADEHDRRVDEDEQPFISHIVELRTRLLRSVLAIVLLFFPIYYFANQIYTFVAAPMISRLPAGSSMIATEVASPFIAPFKLSLWVALFAAMPFLLHQLWGFVSPGLYLREKRLAAPLLFSSIVLFYLGIAFAYFAVFPVVFGFFASITPFGVAMMTDISKYLDFALSLFFAFGLAFEIPIATVLIVWSGITTAQSLIDKRPYIIVGCFVLGMIFTPPDVISQVMLSVPMWLLFELGVLVARAIEPKEEPAPEESGTP